MGAFLAAILVTFSFHLLGGLASGQDKPPNPGGSGALLVKPEQPWSGFAFAALPRPFEAQEMPYTIATDAALDDPAQLARYDIVALSIRRALTAKQIANLKEYVSRGGALYASWGGPYGNEEARQFSREMFRAEGLSPSIYISDFLTVQGAPIITKSLPEKFVFQSEKPLENVPLQTQPGATILLRDGDGRCLGVSSEYGEGRAVLLGICLESAGNLTPREKADELMSNVLRWLLRGRASWDNGVMDIALPARAKVLSVSAGGKPVADFTVQEFGSLKRVRFRMAIPEGQRAAVRIAYEPLPKARNIECIAHFPSGSIERTHSPAAFADLVKKMNVTTVLPHVHGGYDDCIYNGLPEDRRRFESPEQALEKFKMSYKSDFLAEIIEECHKRDIKVYASLYLGCRLAREKYPEVIVVNKDGTRDEKNWVCFNNPKTMEHNWAMLKHLLANYPVDGLIYDDNFGLNCYCDLCKQGFKVYCEGKGWEYVDPQKMTSSGDGPRHWLEYRQSVVHALAGKLAKIVQGTGRPAGAWVGAGLGNDSFAYTNEEMARRFDFLGEMTYTGYSAYARPRADTRIMAKVMGPCRVFALLWAPNKDEKDMVRDVYDAIAGGCDATGFWCLAENQKVKDWVMNPGAFEAIGRALADVENIWMGYYQRNVLTGDRRLSILKGSAGRDALDLEIENTGRPKDTDVGATHASPLPSLDLSGLMDSTIGYRPERGILPERPAPEK